MRLATALMFLIIFLSVEQGYAGGAGLGGATRVIKSLGNAVKTGTRIFRNFFGNFVGGNNGDNNDNGDGDDDCEDCEDKKKRFATAPEDFYIESDLITSKEMHARCRHHHFDVRLGMIQAHLVLIFIPKPNPAAGSNCSNHFAFHSFEPNSDVGQMGFFQEFTPLQVQSKDVAMLSLGEVHGSHLGSTIFSEAAPDHKPYDTIDSNCAHKIIHILQKLGLPISYAVGNFVVENLVKEKAFMESLRLHRSLPKLFPNVAAAEIQAMDDRALASGLVRYTLENEYHGHPADNYKTATIVLASLLGCLALTLVVGFIAYSVRSTKKSERC